MAKSTDKPTPPAAGTEPASSQPTASAPTPPAAGGTSAAPPRKAPVEEEEVFGNPLFDLVVEAFGHERAMLVERHLERISASKTLGELHAWVLELAKLVEPPPVPGKPIKCIAIYAAQPQRCAIGRHFTQNPVFFAVDDPFLTDQALAELQADPLMVLRADVCMAEQLSPKSEPYKSVQYDPTKAKAPDAKARTERNDAYAAGARVRAGLGV